MAAFAYTFIVENLSAFDLEREGADSFGTPWIWCPNSKYYCRTLPLLPLGCNYEQAPIWTYSPLFLVLFWTLLASICCRCSMGSSIDHLARCLRHVFGPSQKGQQVARSNFRHDLLRSRTFAQAIRQLPWLGLGFHLRSNGYHAEALHDGIQPLRRRGLGQWKIRSSCQKVSRVFLNQRTEHSGISRIHLLLFLCTWRACLWVFSL